MARHFLAALCTSALCINSVHTADADLAQQAHAVLKAHCYRCHGQDGSVEGGMNFVLDVKTLTARKKVVPGDAGKSKLYKRMVSDDSPMPPEDEKVRPSKEGIAVIKRWIEAGAPEVTAAPRREFLTDAQVLQAIHDDLLQLDERRRRFTRYFTITHLANLGLSEDELATYRHGLSKLVNSLSWEADIVVPRAVDAGKTILRIDLRDYRWNAAVWKLIVDAYPYGILTSSATARAVTALTECELPYVRADWFVFAASRPPLYHDVLQLPRTDKALERELRVEVAANIQEDRVVRAGFNSSGA
jgi:hypothetical protein